MAFRSMVVLLASATAGCGAASSHSLHIPPAQFRSVLSVGKPTRANPQRSNRNAATLVEEALHARGIRFGTDGSVLSLYAFIRGQFAQIPPDLARPGDVVFFNLGDGCGKHMGLVETNEASGRIGFREWRDGSTRHSFVTPQQPYLRRDEKDRVLNTFLRSKRMADPPATPYFAGEMLCGLFHIENR
jgi:hypothetical protein